MRWTQRSRDGNFAARPFAQDGPWNRIIPDNATYAALGEGWKTLPVGIQSQQGDVYNVTPFPATTSDPLFNVRFYDTYTKVRDGVWLRQDNTLAVENSIISQSTTSFSADMNTYSTTIPGTWTKPPAGSYNAFTNPATLPFQIRMPVTATPTPGADGVLTVLQPDGMLFECYGAVKVSQAQNAIITTRYHMIDLTRQGDGWSNGLSASMCPVIAGNMRNAEIDYTRESGTPIVIPHAIRIVVPGDYLATSPIAYPALTVDSSALTNNPAYNGPNAVPMGSRLALPKNINLDTVRTWSTWPVGKAIAVACQKYGFIITDRGGGGLTLYNERFATSEHLVGFKVSLTADLQWILQNMMRVTSPV